MPALSTKDLISAVVLIGAIAAFCAFVVWINYTERKHRKTLTPEQLAEYKRDSARNPGDW